MTKGHSGMMKQSTNLQAKVEAEVKQSQDSLDLRLDLSLFGLICNPHSDARMITPVHELHKM